MYSLISGLSQQMCRNYWEKREFQLLLIGLDQAGKTSLLERTKYIYNRTKSSDFPLDLTLRKVQPTVGLNIGRLHIKKYSVLIWDLGGQAPLRGIWEKYFADAHALLWTIDASDPSRLQEAAETLATVLARTETTSLPLLILANKSDKASSMTAEEIRSHLLPPSLSSLHGRSVHVVSVSATAAQSDEAASKALEKGIDWLIECLART